jgi:hypothetical protein
VKPLKANNFFLFCVFTLPWIFVILAGLMHQVDNDVDGGWLYFIELYGISFAIVKIIKEYCDKNTSKAYVVIYLLLLINIATVVYMFITADTTEFGGNIAANDLMDDITAVLFFGSFFLFIRCCLKRLRENISLFDCIVIFLAFLFFPMGIYYLKKKFNAIVKVC